MKKPTLEERVAKLEAQNQNSKTVVTFLLDETGSMTTVRDATVSGFNEYIQTLKNKGNNIIFGLSRFNTGKYTPATYRPIKEVGELKDYEPNNGTDLYDSIAKAIKQAEDQKGDEKLFVIMTDGEENSSREFNKEKINNLIKEKQSAGWVFTFMGANQDAWASGGAMGFSTGNSINYKHDSLGVRNAFYAASAMTANFAMNASTMDSLQRSKMFNAKDVDQLVNDQELDPKGVK